MRFRPKTASVAVAGILGAMSFGALGLAEQDFGLHQENQLRAQARQNFGIDSPLAESSTNDINDANADPLSLATFGGGLQARVITSGVAAANIDMLTLWPDDVNPTHLIACNEQGTGSPGVQRIQISDGAVETIVTGTTSCDGARRTPWGTVMFSEEAGGGPNGGRVYELINPLATTGVTLNRATGVFSGGTGAANLVARPALGRLSYEGFALYENGVMYYGDENRPSNGTPGGAYFKFIPATPWVPGSPAITGLADSPFVAGSLYGLRLGKRSGNTDYGQGTELGLGTWIPIPAAPDPDLRAQAAALKLTGYYRPEDIDIDRAAEAAGIVRFCGANTGNEATDHFWGNVVCFTDGTLAQATANTAVPEAQLLVAGNPQLAMADNLAYQPGRGNWFIHEDGDTEDTGHNNDLWACMDDGQDDDTLSDGCVRIGTLNDLDAEWTGGIFDASGERFFVSVQHNVTGKGVVLEVTGWK